MIRLLTSPPARSARRRLANLLEHALGDNRVLNAIWTESRRYDRWGLTVVRSPETDLRTGRVRQNFEVAVHLGKTTIGAG